MGTPSLPPEVVRLILDDVDDLSLWDVLRASHVSGSWRIAARSHPILARDIVLPPEATRYDNERALSNGATSLFLDRLAALPDGQLDVAIFVPVEDGLSVDRVRSLVAPALGEYLPRLVSLTIYCNRDLVPDFLAALRAAPAPRLTFFRFVTAPGDEDDAPTRHVLPLDLFAGHAPLLHTLHMDACQFPTTAVPAFSHVRVLMRELDDEAWHNGVRDLHPERFFVNCPALEELYLNGAFCPLLSLHWGLCPPPTVANLRHLTVADAEEPEDVDEIVRALGHAAMENLEVHTMTVEAGSTDFMLGHLDDSATLELELAYVAETDPWGRGQRELARCTVYDVPRTRRRTFTHLPPGGSESLDLESVDWALQSSFFRAAHRFTSISLPGDADSWRYISTAFYDAQLLNMQHLTITLSGDRLFPAVEVDRQYSLALPALTTVTLVAEDDEEPVEVDVEDLNYLVRDLSPVPAGRSLALELHNVSLIGDIKDLAAAFDIANTREPA